MVGNKHCSYGLCNSDARYRHKDHMKNVFFIPFPKPHRNLARCQQWVRSCGRAEFTIANIKSNSYICSKHFVGGKGPNEEHPDPLPFVATDADIEENETRGQGRNRRKRLSTAVCSSESSNDHQTETGESPVGASSTSQYYYTLVTLPNDSFSVTHLTNTTSKLAAPTSSVISPKLLLISQPPAGKENSANASGSPKASNVVSAGSSPTSPEKNSTEQYSTQMLASTGGEIVAVKNFVIHGQKYTAVHINPEGSEAASTKPPTNIQPRKKNQQDTSNGIFISRNDFKIPVPSPWSVQQDSGNIIFRRISVNDSVLLSICYNEDAGDIVLKVLGMQITSHPILESLPNPIKLSNIAFVLKQFERWKVCVGNPDEKFQAVFHQSTKSSAFYSWIDDSVHSKSCELLCLKERCSHCMSYRGYLRCALCREQKKLKKTSSSLLQETAEEEQEEEPENSGEEAEMSE